MRLLAFDTAGPACSVALWEDGTIQASASQAMDSGHAEALVPMIQAVMAEAGATWGDLDRLAVTVGPGSFTGVRVGLATARGLALASGLPLVGLTTTEVFAHTMPTFDDPLPVILAAVESRRAEIFLQPFTFDPARRPLGPVMAVAPDDLAAAFDAWGLKDEAIAVIGDAAGRLIGQPRVAFVYGLKTLSMYHLTRLAAVRPLPEAPPAALYVRPPDAAIPPGGGRLRP